MSRQTSARKASNMEARMRKIVLNTLLVAALVFGAALNSSAVSSYLSAFNSTYGTSGTALDTCSLCHIAIPSRNAYGSDFAANGHSFAAIESLDSDGDGSNNITEISARTFPGDPNSKPTPPPPPADTTPPSVSLAAPANGATVSGTVTISADASDNVGVAGVQFKVDGNNVGAEDTSAPYSVAWNTTNFAHGSHTITAVARDAAGNTATSATVTVTVLNTTPPPSPPPPPPGGSMPLPVGEQVFNYDPVALPVLNSDPAQAKPLGVGPVADGGNTVEVKVTVGPFAGPVDVFLRIYPSGKKADTVYHLDADGTFKNPSEDKGSGKKFKKKVVWKRNVTGVDETVFGPMSANDLRQGLYVLTLNVKPSGQEDDNDDGDDDDDSYYRWVTYFVVQ